VTFLAPWALLVGVVSAAALVLLHLVARRQPATYLLPTARFIPDRQTLVSRAASRPHDLLLLLLRVLLVLFAAAAFARPVFNTARRAPQRLVLLDRSALVADSARAGADAVAGDSVIEFGRGAAAGNLTAALVTARRAAAALARRGDSVALVLVSPVTAGEVDAATLAVRAEWPGRITVRRVAARADSAVPAALERAMPVSDPLGPALVQVPVRPGTRSVRVLRTGSASERDRDFALAGGTLVVWDSAAAPGSAQGLVMGDDVVVAPLARRTIERPDAVVARWADGAAAAREGAIGAGCLRTVGIGMPPAGDLALRPAMQRVIRGLVAPCTRATVSPASDSVLAVLRGTGTVAASSALLGDEQAPSRLVPWLLGAALLCALLELAVRARGSEA